MASGYYPDFSKFGSTFFFFVTSAKRAKMVVVIFSLYVFCCIAAHLFSAMAVKVGSIHGTAQRIYCMICLHGRGTIVDVNILTSPSVRYIRPAPTSQITNL